jgi:capsular polysaccharide biosynthesis protein|tara:strand:- start:432 stop:1202 length:771 start_codon:yes stop_codon:yes gene_type:complete
MKVYQIGEHGRSYIGHWFSLMLPCLQHVEEFKNDSEKIKLCFKLDYTKEPYQKESLDILSDIIEVVPFDPNAILLPFTRIQTGSKEEFEGYNFLRELYLSRMKNDFDVSEYKKIYIRRNRSHLCEGNKFAGNERNRQILNEDDLVNKLDHMGIKAINLEDYSVSQKIQIFNKASLIVGPNGGGLVFSIFAGLSTKIIEINPSKGYQTDQRHYQFISKALGLDFSSYNKAEKIGRNMLIDVDDVIEFIKKLFYIDID